MKKKGKRREEGKKENKRMGVQSCDVDTTIRTENHLHNGKEKPGFIPAANGKIVEALFLSALCLAKRMGNRIHEERKVPPSVSIVKTVSAVSLNPLLS